ncbi:hypothetical protein DPMN_090194 [Dreissena polymorpha]|uniref:Uncharacterized protein n=1 Tax=Dreissena polymorpha TaxID=45954 RepID=A0A9D4QY41_DREPO|nr:hypothetical protein DPMN_090194 [Dreissena polymorpha]
MQRSCHLWKSWDDRTCKKTQYASVTSKQWGVQADAGGIERVSDLYHQEDDHQVHIKHCARPSRVETGAYDWSQCLGVHPHQ